MGYTTYTHQTCGPGVDAQTPFLESRHHYIRKVYRSRIMARKRKNGSGPEDVSALDPSETADWAVRLWCTAGDIKRASSRKFDLERRFPPEFAKRHTPEWEWLLDES